MAVFIGGLISILVFYALILAVGIWAGKKQKSTEKNPDTEEIMLAGRNIGLIVGIFTMTGKTDISSHLSMIYIHQNVLTEP
jgi:high affinity choline transporter 7